MRRRLLIDVVCFQCQTILAREAEDASWSVKIRARTGDEWHTVTEWQERFICPNSECRAEGFVDAFDMIFAKRDRRRVRVPTRPLL
jgi:hypothetical protein